MSSQWTKEEVRFLTDHSRTMTATEIASRLGRSAQAVAMKRRQMSLSCSRPTWAPEDDEYLIERWGISSVSNLCQKLGRSTNAVMIRVQHLGLPPYLECGEYVTLNQLCLAFTGHSISSYQLKSWIKDRGMPVHNKRRNKVMVRVVYLDEFWEWAEKNRSFLDFSKMEPLALGLEPDWVPEQRHKDFEAFAVQRKDPWSPAEDSRLIMLLKQHKYGYSELSDMLHRSAGAIQRRCTDLGIMERPVKANNHGEGVSWTQKDYDILADGIRNGDSYTLIGRAIGKSEKAVRGKVYFVYLTENADKVRAMMGKRPWGFGAPEPTVKQGIHLSRTRTEVRENLSILDAILRKRMNDLGYDPFWQRFMCMKWNDINGCAAGCTNCDECTDFERIKPQYCRRCGAVIIDRTVVKWRLCDRCVQTSRRQYFKKRSALHGAASYAEQEGGAHVGNSLSVPVR